MKKNIFIIFIIFIILILFILILIYTNKNKTNNLSNINLYSYNNFSTYNSNYNFSEDTNFSYLNSMYYKVIYNYKEYIKYKNIWSGILEVSENDFTNNFMVIIISENESMNGISLGKVYIQKETLYIGMEKKFISEDQNGTSILIDNSMNEKNIEIFKTIENENYYHSTFNNIKELPKDYSLEQAKSDNCICNLNYNINLFYDFIENTNNKKDAFIRLYNYEDNNITITDISYNSSNKKFIICIDETRNLNNNSNYNYYEYDTLTIENISSNNLSFSNSYIFSNSNINEKEFTINI